MSGRRSQENQVAEISFYWGCTQPEEADWVIGIGDDETNLVGSVTEVAVTVTVFPLGIMAGAV